MSKTKSASPSPAQAAATFPADDCANRLKALGDPLRLRVVQLLRYGELTVGDIAQFLDTPLAGISHHLQILKHAQLVTTRRAGRHIYYQLHQQIAQCGSTDKTQAKSGAAGKQAAASKQAVASKAAGSAKQRVEAASINLGCCRLEVPPAANGAETTDG
ncbi:MAG: ArsR/SmtB family transcription factor [Planctomycetota bacterium]